MNAEKACADEGLQLATPRTKEEMKVPQLQWHVAWCQRVNTHKRFLLIFQLSSAHHFLLFDAWSVRSVWSGGSQCGHDAEKCPEGPHRLTARCPIRSGPARFLGCARFSVRNT